MDIYKPIFCLHSVYISFGSTVVLKVDGMVNLLFGSCTRAMVLTRLHCKVDRKFEANGQIVNKQ